MPATSSTGPRAASKDSRLEDSLLGISTRSIAEGDTETGEFPPGTMVDRYVVVGQVGRGGMGVVLAAFDQQLHRKVALKLLHTRRSGSSKSSGSASARLLREAQAIAKLSHPNVISVYDVGTFGEGIYVAMEFVEGCTLTRWLEQRKRTPPEIIDIFLQAGRGLAAAHAALLVHRDFKPDNVLVGVDGQVRVSDFGLARLDPSQVGVEQPPEPGESQRSARLPVNEADVLASPLTQAGVVVGTPKYMAPEQHAGAPADARSDQFAFCVALYQALYGQEPFVAHTLERLARAKHEGRVCPIPSSVRVPSHLEDVVLRGLSPQPADRFPSMEDLVSALERDPTAWRNRIVLTAIGAAVAATVAVGVWFEPDADETACDPTVDPWRGTWGPTEKARLRDILTQADPSTALQTWGLVEDKLDDAVRQWTEIRRDLCARALVPTQQPKGTLELHLQCLQRRLDTVASVLGVLAELTPVEAARVTRVLDAVPTLDVCMSPDFVIAQPSSPTKAIASQIQEVRRGLDRVDAMLALGRRQPAVEAAREAVRGAIALDYPPLVAEAELVLGVTLAKLTQYTEAESVLREAVWAAMRSKHDAVAQAGARELLGVVGSELGRFQEAGVWEQHAANLLVRLGLEGVDRADFDDRAGLLALKAGDVGRARTFIERAIALRAGLFGSVDPGVVPWWIDLGHAALADGDLAAATDAFRYAMGIAIARLDADHPFRADAHVGLGLVAFEQGDSDVAIRELNQARTILARNSEAADYRTARVLWHLARVHQENGQFQLAERVLTEALAACEGTVGKDHPFGVVVLASLGSAQRKAGDLSSARRSLSEADARLRRWDDADPRVIAGVAAELAELDLAGGSFENAAEHFDVAVLALEEARPVNRKAVAEAHFGRARVRWAQTRDPKAKEDIERARAALAAEGPRGRTVLAEIDRWLAETSEVAVRLETPMERGLGRLANGPAGE